MNRRMTKQFASNYATLIPELAAHLRVLASLDQQRARWTGSGANSSSPEEDFSILADLGFDAMIDDLGVAGLTDLKVKFTQLDEAISAWSPSETEQLDYWELILTPQFEAIRKAAQLILTDPRFKELSAEAEG